MDVVRTEEVTTGTGPADWFEGTVTMQKLIDDPLPGGSKLYRVRFNAGARTHWHTHDGEQILIVVDGVCELAERGGEVV
ncbi:MAG: cupin domain-containing protein, partial [Gemmatimonadetes bacterium]|nr:cupin domain-containing protein [Gemmatimonadota bacterium]